MNTLTKLAVIPALAAGLSLGACERTQDETGAPGGTATPANGTADITDDTTPDAVQREVTAFRDTMNRRLEEVNREIQTLEDRSDDIAENMRQTYRDTLDNLRMQRNEFESRLAAAEANTRDAWAQMRAGLEASWEEITDALQAARQQYEDGRQF